MATVPPPTSPVFTPIAVPQELLEHQNVYDVVHERPNPRVLSRPAPAALPAQVTPENVGTVQQRLGAILKNVQENVAAISKHRIGQARERLLAEQDTIKEQASALLEKLRGFAKSDSSTPPKETSGATGGAGADGKDGAAKTDGSAPVDKDKAAAAPSQKPSTLAYVSSFLNPLSWVSWIWRGAESVPGLGTGLAWMRENIYGKLEQAPVIGLLFRGLTYVASIGSATAAQPTQTAAKPTSEELAKLKSIKEQTEQAREQLKTAAPTDMIEFARASLKADDKQFSELFKRDFKADPTLSEAEANMLRQKLIEIVNSQIEHLNALLAQANEVTPAAETAPTQPSS